MGLGGPGTSYRRQPVDGPALGEQGGKTDSPGTQGVAETLSRWTWSTVTEPRRMGSRLAWKSQRGEGAYHVGENGEAR